MLCHDGHPAHGPFRLSQQAGGEMHGSDGDLRHKMFADSVKRAGTRHESIGRQLLSGGNRRVRDAIFRRKQSGGVCMGSALGTCHLKLGAK